MPDGNDLLDLSLGEPRLVGGRCEGCAAVVFPLRQRCPECAAAGVERILLPRRGRLWTWTIQGFEPKPPYRAAAPGADFVPFGVGYVELDGYLKVEGRLTESSPDRLRIGMDMELIAVPYDGDTSYAFAPVGQSEGQ